MSETLVLRRQPGKGSICFPQPLYFPPKKTRNTHEAPTPWAGLYFLKRTLQPRVSKTLDLHRQPGKGSILVIYFRPEGEIRSGKNERWQSGRAVLGKGRFVLRGGWIAGWKKTTPGLSRSPGLVSLKTLRDRVISFGNWRFSINGWNFESSGQTRSVVNFFLWRLHGPLPPGRLFLNFCIFCVFGGGNAGSNMKCQFVVFFGVLATLGVRTLRLGIFLVPLNFFDFVSFPDFVNFCIWLAKIKKKVNASVCCL